MPFEASEDVLLKTLVMCDVYTALSISMVSACTSWSAEAPILWNSTKRISLSCGPNVQVRRIWPGHEFNRTTVQSVHRVAVARCGPVAAGYEENAIPPTLLRGLMPVMALPRLA
jgi:hypothetical protein